MGHRINYGLPLYQVIQNHAKEIKPGILKREGKYFFNRGIFGASSRPKPSKKKLLYATENSEENQLASITGKRIPISAPELFHVIILQKEDKEKITISIEREKIPHHKEYFQ